MKRFVILLFILLINSPLIAKTVMGCNKVEDIFFEYEKIERESPYDKCIKTGNWFSCFHVRGSTAPLEPYITTGVSSVDLSKKNIEEYSSDCSTLTESKLRDALTKTYELIRKNEYEGTRVNTPTGSTNSDFISGSNVTIINMKNAVSNIFNNVVENGEATVDNKFELCLSSILKSYGTYCHYEVYEANLKSLN